MDLTQQLHRAIQAGLLSDVQRLIKEGANMDHVLGMRGTALCAAIEARNLEIAQYLIKAGCDVNVQDYDGEPPLLLALRKDCPGQILGRKPSLEMAKLLIDNEKSDVNVYDKLTKKTALHFIAEQGMDEAAKWLMNAARQCDVNAVDHNGNTALHLSVHDGHYKVVEVLVGNPSCQLKIYNKAGLIPLHICANTGDTRSMNALIARLSKPSKDSGLLEFESDGGQEGELSLNINAITFFSKETCLHLACRNYHTDIVKDLLSYGAKVGFSDNHGNTALMVALTSTKIWQSKDTKIPEMLLRKGANPNVCESVKCRHIRDAATVTPLIVAAMSDNVELARLLVKHGADVNKTGEGGTTALYHALCESARDVSLFLLQECPGINVNTVDAEGNNCLQAALRFCVRVPESQCDVIKALLAAGAVIRQDRFGMTPIDAAFSHENHHALDALLEGTRTRADYLEYCSNGERMSMFETAVTEGYVNMVKVLLAHGADINQISAHTGQSMLFHALYNKEFDIARYLVENGIGINWKQELYNYQKENGTLKENSSSSTNQRQREHAYSDSDDSEETYSEFEDDSDSDEFSGYEYRALEKWMEELNSSPRALQLTCLVRIRTHLRDNNVPMYEVESLPLPQALKDKLRYRPICK